MGVVEIIVIFIFVILLLVVTHELGHFLAARFFNVRVDEFGVGMPPKLFGWKRGETLYSINALPLGGFVRIFGEEEDNNDPRSFSSKSYTVKSLIVVAGVAANVLTAFVLFSLIAAIGVPEYSNKLVLVIEGSPAYEAGLRSGDMIVGVSEAGNPTKNAQEVQSYISSRLGQDAIVIYEREGRRIVTSFVPREAPPEGEGASGVAFGLGVRRIPWYQIPWEGLKTTILAFYAIIAGLWLFFAQLFSTGAAPGDIVGPVGIAVIATETFRIGVVSFLQLIAFLSLNLAVINILPIPALDGGRIFFFMIEKIRGKMIPARVTGVIHSAFFILLLAFLIWISYRDITNLDNYFQLFG